MRGKVIISFVLIILLMGFIYSAEDADTEDTSDEAKIAKALTCVEDKVKDNCDDLGLIDKIFSLFADHECKESLMDDSYKDKCWPSNKCDLETSSQAMLALHNLGEDIDDSVDWMLDERIGTPEDLIWYLQIESPNSTTCEIKYDGSTYEIQIGEDQKIQNKAGRCLSLSPGAWWLSVASSCQEEEFEITCEDHFLTSLLYKNQGSSTIHVLGETHTASAGGTTVEEMYARCLEQDNECDYEGTLWAAMVLQQVDADNVTQFMPYLTAFRDDYQSVLDNSFLYIITGSDDLRNDLLLQQKGDYWDDSGNKMYDTAIALYPFLYEDIQAKTQSREWLLENQGSDGCWGSIKDTSFILHAVFGKQLRKTDPSPSSRGCSDSGFFCMSTPDCSGKTLTGYDCAGMNICCDTAKKEESCFDQSGELCNSLQKCVGGTTITSTDSDSGQTCCVSGICKIVEEEPEEICDGSCRSECFSDESESEAYSTCNNDGICCVTETDEEKSYFWIWILLILIILVVLGIVFRDHLHKYYIIVKNKKKPADDKKRGLSQRREMRRRPTSRNVPNFRMPRAPPKGKPKEKPRMPTTPRKPLIKKTITERQLTNPPAKNDSDMDNVLKRLKDMSK